MSDLVDENMIDESAAQADESLAATTTAENAEVATEAADNNAPKKRWYVVQAYSGYEARVQKALIERIKLQGLEDKFGDILVPTEEIVEMRAGQKRRSERKFFPGYVLVEMVMDEDSWHLVCKTPRVNGFIGGTSDKPAPITQKEADRLLNQIEQGADKPRPKVMFEPGEVVRVTEGPFADFNGEVEEVNYEKSRLRVAVLIFGRSTPVELEFGQVEKG
jgi:transcriptional antiterminator NusG